MKPFTSGMTTLGLMAALAAAAGCPKQTQYDPSPASAALDQPDPVDASLDQIASQPQPSALAAQSQRDVEAILNARKSSPQVEQSWDPVDGLETPPPSPRKAIIWNDPKPSSAAPAAAGAFKSSNGAPHSPAAAPESTANAHDAAAGKVAAGTLGPDRLKTLLVDLSRELYASGAYSDTPLRELLMIAAMSMVDPDRRLDAQAIPDLTPKERELLSTLQTFFAQLGKSLDGNADTEQIIVEAVATLRESLVKQPVLGLPTAALCTRVGGFGNFTPFEKYRFLAQSQQKVIVYLEIDDFESELNQKNEYVTRIAQQLVIYSDRDGIPVWKEDWQTAVDITKNRRQDFFTVQVVTLPKELSVGKYQLKVRVRDEKTQAEAETTIPFEMVADARLAGK